MNLTLDQILKMIAGGAEIARKLGGGGDVSAGATIAQDIIAVIQAGVAALESHTGQPIDLAQLHRVEPVA